MKTETEHDLHEKAAHRFGESRATELDADISRTASDLDAIRSFPISIDDEP